MCSMGDTPNKLSCALLPEILPAREQQGRQQSFPQPENFRPQVPDFELAGTLTRSEPALAGDCGGKPALEQHIPSAWSGSSVSTWLAQVSSAPLKPLLPSTHQSSGGHECRTDELIAANSRLMHSLQQAHAVIQGMVNDKEFLTQQMAADRLQHTLRRQEAETSSAQWLALAQERLATLEVQKQEMFSLRDEVRQRSVEALNAQHDLAEAHKLVEHLKAAHDELLMSLMQCQSALDAHKSIIKQLGSPRRLQANGILRSGSLTANSSGSAEEENNLARKSNGQLFDWSIDSKETDAGDERGAKYLGVFSAPDRLNSINTLLKASALDPMTVDITRSSSIQAPVLSKPKEGSFNLASDGLWSQTSGGSGAGLSLPLTFSSTWSSEPSGTRSNTGSSAMLSTVPPQLQSPQTAPLASIWL